MPRSDPRHLFGGEDDDSFIPRRGYSGTTRFSPKVILVGFKNSKI